MNTDALDKAIFEQHWMHIRHLESERMWIMGIWLGITGAMLKVIWVSEKPTTWSLQALGSMSLAHLILTFAVLLTISKLQLEHSKHHAGILKMTKKNVLMGVWELLGKGKCQKICRALLFLAKRIATIGGVSSSLLIIGIIFDLVLLKCYRPEHRFVCGFPSLLSFFGYCFGLYVIYQALFWYCDDKLKAKINDLDTDGNADAV